MAEQGKDETEAFTSSMDARLWAKAFLKAYEALPAEEGLSEDFVWGWFANAIMRGYDAGLAALPRISPEEEREVREQLVPPVAPPVWHHPYASMLVAEGIEKLNATLLYLFQDAAVPEKPARPVAPGECQEGRN